MKRKDADPIMQALDSVGIPYSFYKQTGLWQSEEAKHVEVLLQTLARPEDRSSLRKALLTCFFRVRPEDLVQPPDLPSRHPGARALSNLARRCGKPPLVRPLSIVARRHGPAILASNLRRRNGGE